VKQLKVVVVFWGGVEKGIRLLLFFGEGLKKEHSDTPRQSKNEPDILSSSSEFEEENRRIGSDGQDTSTACWTSGWC
jgi:hypothetical protein